MKRFENQVVLITGAANGIGKACAQRFAKEGAAVACMDIITDLNEALAADIISLGNEALAIEGDVTDSDDVKSTIDQVMEQWGRIDTLVCSAGIYTGSPLKEVSREQWSFTITTNLTGVFLTNQAVAPIMMDQKSGSIINISSMAGKTSWPASAEYSASKSGVIGLTRSVAMELAPFGATANAICPGNTLTDMVRSVAEKVGALEGKSGEEWLKMRANDCPMKRLAEPWEIAGVIAFLASDDSRYLTGQAIEVDGGIVL
jgi:NAD(P)-dependent dehydrogenase (short-subunit alcohol dehydrogenase family)